MLSHVHLFASPWTVVCQAPLSMKFSRQEYWSGFPFPPPGDLPDLGIGSTALVFPAWQADSLPLCHLGILYLILIICTFFNVTLHRFVLLFTFSCSIFHLICLIIYLLTTWALGTFLISLSDDLFWYSLFLCWSGL